MIAWMLLGSSRKGQTSWQPAFLSCQLEGCCPQPLTICLAPNYGAGKSERCTEFRWFALRLSRETGSSEACRHHLHSSAFLPKVTHQRTRNRKFHLKCSQSIWQTNATRASILSCRQVYYHSLYLLPGWERMVSSCTRFKLAIRKKLFPECSSIRTSCPGKWWSDHHWSCSRNCADHRITESRRL